MKYMGSKNRIAKHILPIILKDKRIDQYYVEPFVGGCNLIDKLGGRRIGSDNNKYLIAMLKEFQTAANIMGFCQSREHYNSVREAYNVKNSSKYPDWYIGLIGYMCSANGRFFEGGYSGISKTKNGAERNYIDESIRNLEKQLPRLLAVDFHNCNYFDLRIPEDSIIYCDPPYQGTKQYSTSREFDYPLFWNWCRKMANSGHTVFVSEYSAPDDFECVWEMELKSSLSANKVQGGSKKSVERLFRASKEKGNAEIDKARDLMK